MDIEVLQQLGGSYKVANRVRIKGTNKPVATRNSSSSWYKTNQKSHLADIARRHKRELEVDRISEGVKRVERRVILLPLDSSDNSAEIFKIWRIGKTQAQINKRSSEGWKI